MLRTRTSKILRLPLLMIVVAALVCISTVQVKSAPKAKFVLSSQDAQLAAKVPEVYTANVFGCTGGNMSPPLQWTGAPAGTKSFVLTLFDPDEHGVRRDVLAALDGYLLDPSIDTRGDIEPCRIGLALYEQWFRSHEIEDG